MATQKDFDPEAAKFAKRDQRAMWKVVDVLKQRGAHIERVPGCRLDEMVFVRGLKLEAVMVELSDHPRCELTVDDRGMLLSTRLWPETERKK